jgi:hypothetical protein
MRVKVFRADSTLRPLPSGLSERRRPPRLGERKKIAGPLGRHLAPFPGGGMCATCASTVPTRQRSVVAAAAPARRSRENSAVGPLPSAGRLVGLAAAAPAGATTTRISRAAAAPIVAPNSGPRAGGGAQPLLTQSGSGIAALNDLVISQSDGVNGLVSLPGLKKNRSGHHSWT